MSFADWLLVVIKYTPSEGFSYWSFRYYQYLERTAQAVLQHSKSELFPYYRCHWWRPHGFSWVEIQHYFCVFKVGLSVARNTVLRSFINQLDGKATFYVGILISSGRIWNLSFTTPLISQIVSYPILYHSFSISFITFNKDSFLGANSAHIDISSVWNIFSCSSFILKFSNKNFWAAISLLMITPLVVMILSIKAFSGVAIKGNCPSLNNILLIPNE